MSPHAAEQADGHSFEDSATLRRLKAGDEQVFRDVVTELTPTLLRLARGYTPTAAAAQDAVQDTWLVVIEKLDGFEGRSSLKTWVCGILINKARRSGVREHRTLPFSSAWRDDSEAAVDRSRFHPRDDRELAGTWASPPIRWDHLPEGRVEATELRRVIDAAIAALPTRQREVMTARDVLGLDAAETSSIFGVSAGNQRVLLHRARSKVRAELEAYSAEAVHDPEPAGPSALSRPRWRDAAPLGRRAAGQPTEPGPTQADKASS